MAGLGRLYQDGEVIFRQGETGNCMYVVQDGTVQAVAESGDEEVVLRTLRKNDFFGEMALFERTVRMATVRARGQATILTVDKHTLMQQITGHPALAFRLVEVMSSRLRAVTARHARIVRNDRRNWESRPVEDPSGAGRTDVAR